MKHHDGNRAHPSADQTGAEGALVGKAARRLELRQVTYSTTTYPYDTVVYITDTIGGIDYLASGVLISPDEVLTASHVVYSTDAGAASNIVVQPGYNAGNAPDGSASGTSYHYFSINDAGDLISSQDSQNDYAVIHLSHPFSGLGTMGVEAGFSGGLVNVTGYPAYLNGQQETSSQFVTVDPNYSLYDGSSLGRGSSGGPVWIMAADGSASVVGLVSSGAAGPGSAGYFTQITSAALNQIDTWVMQDDGAAVATVGNPAVTGTLANQSVSDAATITPFSAVAVTDPNPSQTLTVTVALTQPANGILAGGGAYDPAKGVYTISGNAATVTAVLDALVFMPTRNEATPGQSVTTGFAIQVRDGAGGSASDNATSVIATWLARNGIVFQNDDGSAAVWQMANTTIVGGGVVSFNPGPSWLIRASGDFNGDGQSDILWQNSDGSVAVWDMNGATSIGGGLVAMNPGPSWHVVGTADFNADGHSDILWQNDSGQLAIWEMNGTAIIGGGLVANNPGASWHAVGTGDFYGDGGTDVLWRNTSGSLVIWQMNGVSVVGGGAVSLDPGPSWHVKGIADMNGDGKSDIVFQNDNGAVAVWDMSGATVAGGGIVGINPGPSWHLRGTGDFGSDGKAELLWQNDNGQLALWGLDGTAVASGGMIGVNPGASWHALGLDGMRFISGDAAILTATPGPDEFVFTSPSAGTHTISGFSPTQDIIELSAAAFAGFAQVQSASASLGGGTLLSLGGGSSLLIQGVAPGALSAGDFVFV